MLPVLQRAVAHFDMTEELADILSTRALEVEYRVECGKYATSERTATASAAAMQAALTSGHRGNRVAYNRRRKPCPGALAATVRLWPLYSSTSGV